MVIFLTPYRCSIEIVVFLSVVLGKGEGEEGEAGVLREGIVFFL